MVLHQRQNDNRSKLQENLAAELNEKARKRAQIDHNTPDGVGDSSYMDGTKQTTSLAWVWVLIVIAGVSALIWLMNMVS